MGKWHSKRRKQHSLILSLGTQNGVLEKNDRIPVLVYWKSAVEIDNCQIIPLLQVVLSGITGRGGCHETDEEAAFRALLRVSKEGVHRLRWKRSGEQCREQDPASGLLWDTQPS